MPGCVAVGCNNRSEKGYIMKCFPRNQKLRKIWQKRVARANWEPSNNSFLCDVHFVPQAWYITKSGRIKLKTNAVPSIFTVTSSRRSHKKRIKTPIVKKENVSENEYSVDYLDYLENDTEYSSTGHLDEKDFDFQDIHERILQTIKQKKLSRSSKPMEAKNRIHSGLPGANIMVLIDHNKMAEMSGLGMELNDNPKEATNATNKNSTGSQVSNTMEKTEDRLGIMDGQVFDDSYDEIEERLKQICDGGSTEDDNNDKNENRKEIMVKLDKHCGSTTAEVDYAANTNHNFLMKHEIGHILANKRENVEIIFGIESADEKSSVSQTASCNKHPVTKTKKIDETGMEDSRSVSIKNEMKGFNEDIEENFTKDEVHVIPNIRAAMKRKRRTREEIMKSIKKSIRSTSDLDLNSSSDTELSERMDNKVDLKNELTISLPEIIDITGDDTPTETTKFTIKVTGDPDDITEIIEDLSPNAIETQAEKNSVSCKVENEAFVSSIITVLTPKIAKEMHDNAQFDDYTIPKKKVIKLPPHNERGIENSELLHSPDQCQPSYSRRSMSWSDEEDRNQATNINSPPKTSEHCAEKSMENSSACYDATDYEDLLQKVKVQEDVIAKLTDQLIVYKELEHNIQNKSVEREVQTTGVEPLSTRRNTRSSNVQSLVVNKKNLESKQRLIEDLSNRVNYFEETNKKLMKTVTLESQCKRKLEGQIKQKDTRIKELNWKLEKASKYLERAEKNSKTYRRKMLNLQAIIKKKKVLDEKLSNFNDMLIDSTSQEYTKKALSMALDIRKICGRNGYDKLLSYGFPLPPLPALRKGFVSGECTDYNESDVEKVWIAKSNVQSINACMKNKRKINTKDSELLDAVTKASEFDSAETVTGTVQDIFNENNDGDDFSTNELREHFILQLNAVM